MYLHTIIIYICLICDLLCAFLVRIVYWQVTQSYFQQYLLKLCAKQASVQVHVSCWVICSKYVYVKILEIANYSV